MAKEKVPSKKGYSNYIDKPWGYELIVQVLSPVGFSRNGGDTIHKILVVLPKEELSYQYHNQRNETWEIKSGECEITINDVVYTKVYPGTIWKIEPGVKHSVKAITPTVIDELSQNYVESDIVRLEDKYGRAKKWDRCLGKKS